MREIWLLNERFILHPSRVLYWPDQNLLVVSDLELGKAERFLYGGLTRRSQAQWEDLVRLTKLCRKFQVEHLMILGDFIHSPHGVTEEIVQDFSDFLLRIDSDVTLICEDQDRGAIKLLGALFPKMEMLYQWQIGSFIFQHKPPTVTPDETCFHWCGHQHPVVEVREGDRTLHWPCFVINSNVGILPAYSSLSDGTVIEEKVDRKIYICSPDEEAFIATP